MSEESSNYDQTVSTPHSTGLSRSTLFASVLLLLLPAAIPLFFVSQTDEPAVIGIFVGTSLMVILLNVLMLRLILRWVSRMAKQAGEEQEKVGVAEEESVSS